MKKIFVGSSSITQPMVDKLLRRSNASTESVESIVKDIICDVKLRGDDALKDYTKKFDKVDIDDFKVSTEEIDSAFASIDSEFKCALVEAKNNIERFHSEQIQSTWLREFSPGVTLGQKITPIHRVGLYVPGGKGGYPSTVLMDSIPALVAGVNSLALITPPDQSGKINPLVLSAAKIVGITEIYKVGGAQGIAALAYGTESIDPVDKIVGPGNVYVTAAKKAVFGKVDIDMIAGPSENCIIADENGIPSFIAADMLSQAEHDQMATSMLITNSEGLAEQVQVEVKRQLSKLTRREILDDSLNNNCKIIIVNNLIDAVNLTNLIAPEHLQVMTENPISLIDKIENAGAIFIGKYSPVPIGDYYAGPNHTLPTSGTAKFSSPLGVYDFVKKSSIIHYKRTALQKVADRAAYLANAEGFDAHAHSLKIRLNNDEEDCK